MFEDAESDMMELSIADVRQGLESRQFTSRDLVDHYVDRIESYDRNGPKLNSVIFLSDTVREDAEALDRIFAERGAVGPLHGVTLLVKDQIDVAGMPTTMGSVLFEHHRPERTSFALAKLKRAGALILGKTTLGELGAGDTHGSLFGSTKNAYDPLRTAGGSSGGSGAAVSANFCTAAIGQEGFSSIRRPAAWNGIAGMRPTAGLISRTGVYGGWPAINGALGPMARSVSDLAQLLDTMVGYDDEDPLTAMGAHRIATSYAAGLDRVALKGSRIGILRESCGSGSDPLGEDFAKVDAVFDHAVEELRTAGSTIVDPIVIPDLNALLATRCKSETEDAEAFRFYVEGCKTSPFTTREEAMTSELFKTVSRGAQARWRAINEPKRHHAYLEARETLMIRLHQVMAAHELDAIVHKAVEHQPTLIEEGINPPYRDQTGAIHINTFLVYVPSVVVPCGFTSDDLPVGLTFLGRPYDDANMLRYAFAYEQATHHRRIPPQLR